MKKFLTALALAAAALLPAASALDPAAERIVVLISVDGLAHYYFDDPRAEMPKARMATIRINRACTGPSWPGARASRRARKSGR